MMFLCLLLAAVGQVNAVHIGLGQRAETLGGGKKVAFVLSLPYVDTNEDGSLKIATAAAVVAAAVQRANTLSNQDDRYELVAFIKLEHEQVGRAPLEGLGYKVMISEMPVPVQDMLMPLKRFSRDKGNDKNGLVVEEHISLKAWTLTQYDKVVLVEPDVLVLDALDELVNDSHELIGIYDYYGWTEKYSVVPPINGGWMVLTPFNDTHKALVEMIKRGSFSSERLPSGFVAGWDRSGIGYYFGGISLQGILSAHYHKELTGNVLDAGAPGPGVAFESLRHDPTLKFKEVDQCVYNCLGHSNCRGRAFGVQGTEQCKNSDCSPDVNPTAESVLGHAKVAHFTGSCTAFRPYVLCKHTLSSQEARALKEKNVVCYGFLERWAATAKLALRHTTMKEFAPQLESCSMNLTNVN